MKQPPFHSADIRNVMAAEFMRIAGCEKVEGPHGDVCAVHQEVWSDSGCMQTVEAANDLLIPVMDVIRAKVLPTQ